MHTFVALCQIRIKTTGTQLQLPEGTISPTAGDGTAHAFNFNVRVAGKHTVTLLLVCSICYKGCTGYCHHQVYYPSAVPNGHPMVPYLAENKARWSLPLQVVPIHI